MVTAKYHPASAKSFILLSPTASATSTILFPVRNTLPYPQTHFPSITLFIVNHSTTIMDTPKIILGEPLSNFGGPDFNLGSPLGNFDCPKFILVGPLCNFGGPDFILGSSLGNFGCPTFIFTNPPSFTGSPLSPVTTSPNRFTAPLSYRNTPPHLFESPVITSRFACFSLIE